MLHAVLLSGLSSLILKSIVFELCVEMLELMSTGLIYLLNHKTQEDNIMSAAMMCACIVVNTAVWSHAIIAHVWVSCGVGVLGRFACRVPCYG